MALSAFIRVEHGQSGLGLYRDRRLRQRGFLAVGTERELPARHLVAADELHRPAQGHVPSREGVRAERELEVESIDATRVEVPALALYHGHVRRASARRVPEERDSNAIRFCLERPLRFQLDDVTGTSRGVAGAGLERDHV